MPSAVFNHTSRETKRLSRTAAAFGPWLPLGLVVVALGCHFDEEGLDDILSSSPTYVNFPGTRLVSGRVSSARNENVDSFESRVVAQRDNGELVIIDVPKKQSCSLGVVAAYPPYGMPDNAMQTRRPRVAFLSTQDANGSGELSFADWDCNVWSTGLKHAELPSFHATVGEGYLLRDAREGGDTLVVVNPWTRTVTEIASGTTALQTNYYQWFSLEGSELVVRDRDLSERLRVQDVATTLPLTDSRVAVLMTNGLLFVENLLTGVVRLVARDACDLSDADFDLWSPMFNNIAFRSPCNDATLRLYNHTTQTTWQVGIAGQFANARVAAHGNYVYVLENPTAVPNEAVVGFYGSWERPRYIGTLWGASLEHATSSEPLTLERLGERAWLPVPASEGNLERMVAPLILADYDGTVGRLLVWHPGAGTSEIATNVRELDGGLALVNWDGTSGDVLAAPFDPPELLPLRLTSFSAATLAYGDSGATSITVATATGDVIRIRGSWAAWYAGSTPRIETVASGVLDGQYGWFSDNIIGYTRDDGAGNGTLVVRFTDTDDTFEQKGVSHWQYAWPDFGILYFVDSGSKAGLWFAPFR